MSQCGFMKPETDMASSRNTDSFLPIWSGIGYSIEVFLFWWEESITALCSQTDCEMVWCSQEEHLFLFERFFFFFWCRCWHDYGDIKYQHQALKPVISDLICWTLCQSHAVLTHPLRIIIRNFGAVFGWGCLKQDYGCTLNWNCDLKKMQKKKSAIGGHGYRV